MLTTGTPPPGFFNFYSPSFFAQPLLRTRNDATPLPPTGFAHPYTSNPVVLAKLDNQGKVLTGKDRQGDEWQITVHGPGYVIVTDATPNDGTLDDDIDTITLVGTDPNKTFVTGQVTASARLVTGGTVPFNHLFAQNGVASIILNGFDLAQTVLPPGGMPNNTGPEIYLPGGVRYLQFHDIQAPINLAANDQPIDIVVGDPSNPLTFKPTIRVDSINNTVFDATAPVNANIPQTTPTVQFVINGQLNGLEFLSAAADPTIPQADLFAFPIVGTTGRTAVRALGIDRIKSVGSARNFTASRGQVPFQNNFSGLDHLGSASFGGNADAVGLDVNGPIGSLTFARGLGNPAGTTIAGTASGTSSAFYGYPQQGLLGGLVTGSRIGRVKVAPANVDLQVGQDPDLRQVGRTNSTTYFFRPGRALTSAAITSAGSIGSVQVVGSSQASEIKSGFDYVQYAAGLEGTRAPSRIGNFQQRGDLIDSVVSATYRPKNGRYGNVDPNTGQLLDTVGPGTIRGNLRGALLSVGSQTALGNTGVGVFARRKIGHLPPPEGPRRVPGHVINP